MVILKLLEAIYSSIVTPTSFRTSLPCSNNVNALLEEHIKDLLWVLLKVLPVPSDESFQLKNSSIGLSFSEYGGKYTSFTPASSHICSIRSL